MSTMNSGPAVTITPNVVAATASANQMGYDPSTMRQAFILAQSGAPVILPSSGSSNATGQITLTTALPYQPSGTVGVYLPAGVVTAGSQGSGAGVYQVTFSSTSVCQIAGTGIVTANGAYTQTTGAVSLVTLTVPGGAMGANGSLRSVHRVSAPSNANAKGMNAVLGGQTFVAMTVTTSQSAEMIGFMRNRGTQAVQSINATGLAGATGLGNSSSPNGQLTLDTSVNLALVYQGSLAVATDYVILEGYTVEVLPSA